MHYTLWLNRKELVYELVFMRRGWGGNCVINITWMQISHFSNNAPVLHGPVKHLHVEAMLMWHNPASSNKVKVKTNNYNFWLSNMRPCSCQFKLVCEHAITDFFLSFFWQSLFEFRGKLVSKELFWAHPAKRNIKLYLESCLWPLLHAPQWVSNCISAILRWVGRMQGGFR